MGTGRLTWRERRSKRGQRHSASPRWTRQPLRRAFPEARLIVMGPRPTTLRGARRARIELVVSTPGPVLGPDPGPPEARHGDGALGTRVERPRAERRGLDEPPRLRRVGPGLHEGADAALHRRHRGVSRPDPARREQRRALFPGGPPRRALRDRALRHLAVRREPGRRRSGPHSLGVGARPGEAPCSAKARATDDATSPSDRPGSGSSPSVTQTAFAVTRRARRFSSPVSAAASSARSRWTRSPSSFRPSCRSARR